MNIIFKFIVNEKIYIFRKLETIYNFLMNIKLFVKK